MGMHIERRWLDAGPGPGHTVNVLVWESEEPVRVEEPGARPAECATGSDR
jgi:hypothetical protein